MRLTRRGWAVLTGAACCYLVGLLAGYPLLRIVGMVSAAVVVVAVLTARFPPAVEVFRSVSPDRIERGGTAQVTLTFRNNGSRRRRAFAAVDRAGTTTERVQVRPLAPGAEETHHYDLVGSKRGRFPLGPLVLSPDPFGLASSDRSVGDTAYLWVYPRRHRVRPASASYPWRQHDGPVTGPLLHGSTDLRAIREYEMGDSVRYLHWRATARTGRLMVRDYADPAQTRFTTLLDTRPAAMRPAEFEEAVEVAASLLGSSASAGQHCRLITSSGTDVSAGSGLPAIRLLLDELAGVAQDAAGNAPLVPPPSALAPPGGALVAITGHGTGIDSSGRWRPDVQIRLGSRQQDKDIGVIYAADAVDAAEKWNTTRAGTV